MQPPGDDCLTPAKRSALSMQGALERILPHLSRLVESETVPLRAAVSRVLAQEVVSRIDVPGADNSAVDGYAVHFDDLDAGKDTRLAVVGRGVAGPGLPGSVSRGGALRIFTGALMPAGPDTVIMQEDCRRDGEVVVVPPGLRRGSNRRRAGEDVRAGTTVLPAGIRLRPQEVGLAAAVGCTHLRVGKPLRVALVDARRGETSRVSGSEAAKLGRQGWAAFLRQLGTSVSEVEHGTADLDALTALARAAASHDVLLAVGKLSPEDLNHVVSATGAPGSLHIWHLTAEPECELGLGRLAGRNNGALLIQLPEDAMAAMIVFLFIVRPILMRLLGRSDPALHSYRLRTRFAHMKNPASQAFLPVRLERSEDGEPVAAACARLNGTDLIHEADGVIEMPEGLTGMEPGAIVEFFPFDAAGA
jgi:molybdopterin molybdotransferase